VYFSDLCGAQRRHVALGQHVRRPIFAIENGSKATGSPNVWSYWSSSRPSARAVRHVEAVEVGLRHRRTICRMRSERKFQQITASPSRIGPTGRPSSATTIGLMNSSVSPRS
jgi:hypothetical protein